LLVYMFVSNLAEAFTSKQINDVVLKGTICKAPTMRLTPSCLSTTGLLNSTKRSYSKSDCTHCICRGMGCTVWFSLCSKWRNHSYW